MADVQYPQYPDPIGPSFSSLAQRQRMEIEDALAAEQAQKEREQKVITQGGKAFVGYNEMLRGFMEAKYASPELKFWDYVQNPSVGAAYRLEGKRKILEDVKSGVDPKDIPGMKFGERHKAGLKGIFGGDAKDFQTEMKIHGGYKRARKAGYEGSKADWEKFVESETSRAVGAKGDEHIVASLKEEGAKIADAREALGSVPGDAKAAALEYSDAATDLATEEATKGGLKSTLGKVAGGIGAGVSIASGVERMKSKDERSAIGRTPVGKTLRRLNIS